MQKPKMPIWHDDQGNNLSCTEKVKVMSQNMDELWQMLQDAYEDALLMGCNDQQIKMYLEDMVKSLHNPYQK
ncbi:hypothetical protein [Neisseria sp. Ec49-e6-T10]|uniref:hypothetical protein n=1 Tax=Neisseria sp. Ec49-e6-T10 TaxID=3140744 RepID=UPI003EB7A87E